MNNKNSPFGSSKRLTPFQTQSVLNNILEAGNYYGTLTVTEAINISSVNRTTFERWLRGETSAPRATLELLRLHAFGEPPSKSNEWKGWMFKAGKLINRDYNETFSPNDIKASIFWQPLYAKAEGEINALKRLIDDLQAFKKAHSAHLPYKISTLV